MIDTVEITVVGGKGGDGLVSFRREKFLPRGGPSGGDGGRGGDVYIQGDADLNTLMWFRHKRVLRAGDGKPGGSNDKKGRQGEDLVLKVPAGTQVFRREGEERRLVVDVETDGMKVKVAGGGRGGWGNARFATPTRQAPTIAKKGEPGEELTLELELKLIADVGIIGMPSVGKSTLLRAASAATPAVAEYPFTTTEPVLGVVDMGDRPFILAEIPGLIEGAHTGKGLGHLFLRHTERTRLLVHLLDGSSPSPPDDMRKVNLELKLHQEDLLEKKPQVIVVNKIDLSEVRERIPSLEKELGLREKPVFFISAATGEGVRDLMAALARMVEEEKRKSRGESVFVFRPAPRDSSARGKAQE